MTGDVAESHISQHGLVSLGARNEIDNACPAYEEDREKSIAFQLIILIIIQINMHSNRRQFFKKGGLGLTALAAIPLLAARHKPEGEVTAPRKISYELAIAGYTFARFNLEDSLKKIGRASCRERVLIIDVGES